jgi:diamine N-acetyltransferase
MRRREMKQLFESERIRFVEVTEELVPDYLRMVNDLEHVGRFIGRRTEPVSEEKERKWVREKLDEKAVLFSMIEKSSGAFIGNIELMDFTETEAELGIAITAAKQELGYGTEAIRAVTDYAFDQLVLKRVFLKVYPDNARAIRVYEKCGFREYDRTEEDVFMEILA